MSYSRTQRLPFWCDNLAAGVPFLSYGLNKNANAPHAVLAKLSTERQPLELQGMDQIKRQTDNYTHEHTKCTQQWVWYFFVLFFSRERKFYAWQSV